MKAYLEIDMPRCCNKCPLFVYEGIGICVCRVLPAIEDDEILKPWKNRRKECPLKAVKEHGRLIDADALHALFEYQWHHLQVLNWNGNPTAKARQSGINWCISTMRDSAPTIIQASEEGE